MKQYKYKNQSLQTILKMERMKRAYTQLEMANFLNISLPTYLKYEHGGTPTLAKSKLIAKKLNIDIEDITYIFVENDYNRRVKKWKM